MMGRAPWAVNEKPRLLGRQTGAGRRQGSGRAQIMPLYPAYGNTRITAPGLDSASACAPMVPMG